MKSELELITPELAKKYLALNRNPRKLQKWHVEEFVNIIKRGQFFTTHQGIAFRIDGTLCDGQHRLAAIVACGIAVRMWVTRGLNDDASLCLDRGMKRSNNDILGVDSRVGQVISLAACLIAGQRPTNDDLLKVYAAIGSEAEDLIRFCGAQKRAVTQAGVKLGCVLNMLTTLDRREYAMNQYRHMVHGEYSKMSPLISVFHRQLADSRFQRDESVCKAITAFDHMRKDMKHLILTEKTKCQTLHEIRTLIRQIIEAVESAGN